MRIAIVGTRHYRHTGKVRELVNSLPPDAEIVSGGGGDVDRAAESAAIWYGRPFKIFRADWKQHGRAAGPIRNRQIVDYADRVIAFWDGKSRGTKSTIDLATAAGKPVEIIDINQQDGEAKGDG